MGRIGRGLGHVAYFYSFYITEMGKVRDFKFGVRVDRQAYKPRNAKVGQKGHAYATWLTFIILGPVYISGMGKARDFKIDISKTVIDTMLGLIEVEWEITHGLSIGTVTFDLGWPWTVLDPGHRTSTSDINQSINHLFAWKNNTSRTQRL